MSSLQRAKIKIINIILKFFWIFPIKQNKIVFSCFSGKRYGDSPRAIAEEIIRQNLNYEMVWLMRKEYKADLPHQIKRRPFFVISQLYQLATAKLWIDSHIKDLFIEKRKGQYYIETWHGCLSKKVEGDAAHAVSSRVLEACRHNSELADLFISNSRFTSEMYRRAFWYKGEILERGCPKNDIYFQENPDIIDRVRNAFNISPDKKIALYAPTFRVDLEINHYTLDYSLTLDGLKEKFGGDWVLLVRLHPLLIKRADGFIHYTDNIKNASEYSNMQDLLYSSDVYITDYSSPMFEFSLSKKPVFLFAADYDDYMQDRGWYFDYFNMPFPAANNNEEFYHNILSYSQDDYEKKLESFWQEIGLYEKGTAAKEVVKIIKIVAPFSEQ